VSSLPFLSAWLGTLFGGVWADGMHNGALSTAFFSSKIHSGLRVSASIERLKYAGKLPFLPAFTPWSNVKVRRVSVMLPACVFLVRPRRSHRSKRCEILRDSLYGFSPSSRSARELRSELLMAPLRKC
jgi:hypothetical protein